MLQMVGILKNLGELTNLKAGIYQPKTQYALEVSAYSLVAFLMPILLVNSQFFLGTIVNAMLISGALYTKGKKMLPLIFLPSLGVLIKGALFGSLMVYFVYMLPFIWAGNTILVYSIKGLHLKNKLNLAKSAAVGSILKAGFLFGSAFTLFSLGIVPEAFLTTFGLMQLVTALSAGAIMYPLHGLRLKKQK